MSNKQTENQPKKLYNTLLIIGLSCIALGIIIQICLCNNAFFDKTVLQGTIITYLGVLFLYFGYIHTKKFPLYFFGFVLAQTGIYWLIVNISLHNLTINHLWPGLLIIIGESLFISSLVSKKRISFSVIVPSISLVLLGLFFFLFSLDIIETSFVVFATTWWPIVLILAGIILLAIFFYKQAEKRNTGTAKKENEE